MPTRNPRCCCAAISSLRTASRVTATSSFASGRIAEISRRRPARTENVRFLETRRGEWIFPGLINLHTHATYNFLPLWRSPASPFANRFEWRGDASYKKDVGGFARDFAKRDGMREIISVFGELQAVAGGTAILQEDFALDAEKKLGGLLLCRDTAAPEDFGLPPDRQIMSVVDFFQPGPDGAPRPLAERIQAWRKARDAGSLVATIVHLAEGRSGFGSNRGVDPYSRAEFEAFMALPEMQDARAVRQLAFLDRPRLRRRMPGTLRISLSCATAASP